MNIMIISPHPDDAELAIGGTIFSLSRKGNNIYLLDLTNGEPTPYGSVKKRLQEAKKSAEILKITERIILEFPNRYLQDKIEYRIKVAEYIRLFRPEVLLVPFNIDAHPDHIVTHSIGIAARFYAKFTKTEMKGAPFYPSKLLFYICSHMRLNINPSFIYPLTKKEFDKKMSAIKSFKSQFSHGKNRGIPHLIEDFARYWGRMVGAEYGEVFYTPEVIGIKDFSAILL